LYIDYLKYIQDNLCTKDFLRLEIIYNFGDPTSKLGCTTIGKSSNIWA